MKILREFLTLSMLSYRATSIYKNWGQILLIQCLLPLSQMAFFILVGMARGHQTIGSETIAVNNLVYFGYLNLSIFIVNSVSVERNYGTLKSLVLSPMSLLQIFLSKMIVPYLITSLCQTILIVILSSMNLITWNLALCEDIYIMNVCFSAFSMMLGILLLPFRRSIVIVNVLGLIIMFVSGINFPLKRLPSNLNYVSKVFPLVYARQSSDFVGNNHSVSVTLIGTLAFLTCVYLLMSIILASRVESLSIRRSKLL